MASVMAGSPAACPLFAQVVGEVNSPDDLVRYGNDAWGSRRIVGLRELRVAVALIAWSGEVEGSPAWHRWKGLLHSVYEEAQFGGDEPAPASLLDLAVRFGHAELARCLRERGQRQQRRLGVYDLQSVPTASLAKLPIETPGCPYQDRIYFDEWHWHQERDSWVQQNWAWRGGAWQEEPEKVSPLCPWAQGAGEQDWAPDWRAASPCARLLVDTPATRAALALVADGAPVDLEEGAELRLLDAAVLLGDPAAAEVLAGRCGARRPVRFWEATALRSADGAGCVEAHLRGGARDVKALGFASREAAAEMAVNARACGLAGALSDCLGEGEPVTSLRLEDEDLVGSDELGFAAVPAESLDALDALASPPPACVVRLAPGDYCMDSDSEEEEQTREVSLLFFAMWLGDGDAATRLLHLGLRRQDLDQAWLLTEPSLEHVVGVDLKPAPIRLEVAASTLRQLFAAMVRRSLSTVAAAKKRGLLGRPELLEHVAGFAAAWSDVEEGLRQEVKRFIGWDPLGDLAADWMRPAPPPATANAGAARAASPARALQPPSECLADALEGDWCCGRDLPGPPFVRR